MHVDEPTESANQPNTVVETEVLTEEAARRVFAYIDHAPKRRSRLSGSDAENRFTQLRSKMLARNKELGIS